MTEESAFAARIDERLLTVEREMGEVREAVGAIPPALARLETCQQAQVKELERLGADLREHMRQESAAVLPKVQLAVMGLIGCGSLVVGTVALLKGG